MTKIIQTPQTLFLSVFESVFVSEEPLRVEIIIIEISTIGGQLSEQQITNFMSLYEKRCSKITKREALEKGLILVYLMKTILLENERQEKSAKPLKNNIKNLD